jgi:hypothetical protein
VLLGYHRSPEVARVAGSSDHMQNARSTHRELKQLRNGPRARLALQRASPHFGVCGFMEDERVRRGGDHRNAVANVRLAAQRARPLRGMLRRGHKRRSRPRHGGDGRSLITPRSEHYECPQCGEQDSIKVEGPVISWPHLPPDDTEDESGDHGWAADVRSTECEHGGTQATFTAAQDEWAQRCPPAQFAAQDLSEVRLGR